MTFLDLIDKYGIFAGLGILLVLTLIPLIRDKIIPEWIKERAAREAFRRQIEIERLASAKKTDENIAALAQAQIQQGERMVIILQNQTIIQERENDILQVLNEGISAMRERVARREGYEQRKKETGPLGEDKEK